MSPKPPRKIITNVLIKCLMDYPMWGCLLVRLNVIMTRNLVPKLGTDGKHLIVNSDWVNATAFSEVLLGCIHEAIHIAFKHIFRRGNRDFDRWNRAIDHATNLILAENFQIPPTWLCDRRFKGLSAEKIYAILDKEETPEPQPRPEEKDESQGEGEGDQDEQDQNQDQDQDSENQDQDQDQDQNQDQDSDDEQDQDQEGQEEEGEGEGEGEEKESEDSQPGDGDGDQNDSESDQPGEGEAGEGEPEGEFDGKFDPNGKPVTRSDGGPDVVFDHPSMGEPSEKTEEELIDIAIQTAYEIAKSTGKAPGCFAAQMEARTKHVIDYRELLRDWLAKNVFNQDYNWMVPDRRFVGTGFHIPALADGDGQAKVLLIVDSSGSMLNEMDMGKTAAEIQGVLEEFPGRYWVLYTDTCFQGAQEITYENPLRLDLRGGGGTDFKAIMEHVRQETEIEFEAILFFTDMATCSFGRDPEKLVLWMSTSQNYQKPPFGKVIEIRDCGLSY